MKHRIAGTRFWLGVWAGFSPFTRAAFIRAVKTMAQVALSYLATVGRLSGVNWMDLIDLVGFSGMLSILTSVSGGLPEAPLQQRPVGGDDEDARSNG